METEYENIGYISDTWKMLKGRAKEIYERNKDKIDEIIKSESERGKPGKLQPSLSINLGQPKVW